MLKRLVMSAAIVMAFGVAVSGCEISINDDSIKGSGKIISENRQASSFDAIHNSSPFNVLLIVDGKNSVEVEGDDNFVKEVETAVEDGTLVIRNKRRGSFHFSWGHTPTTVKIHVAALKKITNSGSGDMEIRQLHSDKLDFLNEGSGDVQASGSVGELTFRANGSGDVNFRQLTVKKLDIEMNGSGDTELGEVGSNLVVQINGSGDLNIAKLNS